MWSPGRHMPGQVVCIVVHEGEEALDARRGVVGALPLVPVRQHEHQPRALAPPLLRCPTRQSHGQIFQTCTKQLKGRHEQAEHRSHQARGCMRHPALLMISRAHLQPRTGR